MQIVLFDTDLIDFSDEDFAYGEADIKEADEDGREEHSAEDEDMEDDCCSDCPYFCPICGECMYEDEDLVIQNGSGNQIRLLGGAPNTP